MLIYWQAGGGCARIKHRGIFVAMTGAGGPDPDVGMHRGGIFANGEAKDYQQVVDASGALNLTLATENRGTWTANVKSAPRVLQRRLEPLLRRLFHLRWQVSRGMTLGVRGVVLDGDNNVFLVKHGYVAGWHLPGGGVEVGESFAEALRRELIEEGRIELASEPELHGLFFNSHVSRRDHVAVYIIRRFRQDRLPEPNREIAACGFFSATALPDGTTVGTRLRISEVLDGVPRIATWR